MIGIYRIRNKVNDKCYYGSSKNIEKRWQRHKNELKNNNHNPLLQRAWNKYGESNFVFEVIEECELSVLLQTEQKYLDLLPEYNIGLNASGGDNLSKNPNKVDIIEKITKAVRERIISMTDIERKEKFSKPMDTNPNWKGGSSFKNCECGEKINPTNKTCIKCRDKSGKNNPFYGKTHTNETKLKLSKKRIGTYNGKQNIPIIIDNIEYCSLREASKILTIPIVTIRWRVLSKNKKFENYKYKN